MLPKTTLVEILYPKTDPTEKPKHDEPEFNGAGDGASKSDGVSLDVGGCTGAEDFGDSTGGETVGGDAGVGEAAGEGDGGAWRWWVLFLTAITTTTSFWPLLQLSPFPLMKK